jgi:hypothetical protein
VFGKYPQQEQRQQQETTEIKHHQVNIGMPLSRLSPLVNGETLASERVDSVEQFDRGPQFRLQTPVCKVESGIW